MTDGSPTNSTLDPLPVVPSQYSVWKDAFVGWLVRTQRRIARISRRTLVLLISAFFLLGISIVLEKLAPTDADHKIWSILTLSAFIREISFALGIAFAVIATVEFESREEFNKAIQEKITDIQKNVFHSTFERHIPRKVINEVNELIFSTHFVRLRHEAVYNLHILDVSALLGPEALEVPQMDKLVQVEVISRYTIKNVGFDQRPFTIRLTVEKPPIKKLQQFTKVQLMELQLNDTDIRIPDGEINDTPRAKTVTWVTDPLPPGAELKVRTSATLVKFLTDYEIWRSVYPTRELRVRVNYPAEATAFGADQLHRLPLKKTRLGPNTREYEIDGAILPHQGMVLWWCCEGDKAHYISDADGPEARS